jgi:hypothetical protein
MSYGWSTPRTPLELDNRVPPGYDLAQEYHCCTRLFMCGATDRPCNGIPSTAVLCPPAEQTALAATWQGIWRINLPPEGQRTEPNARPWVNMLTFTQLEVRDRLFLFTSPREGNVDETFEGELKFFRDGNRLYFDRLGSYVLTGDPAAGAFVATVALGSRQVCTREQAPPTFDYSTNQQPSQQPVMVR